jgi:hypothetical protein
MFVFLLMLYFEMKWILNFLDARVDGRENSIEKWWAVGKFN